GTCFVSSAPRARPDTGSWLMLVSGTPKRVILEPRYPASTLQFLPKVFCSVKFHCCMYPEPVLRSTPKTPWPSPEFGLGGVTSTVGPFERTNAGLILSSDRWPTL